MLPIFILTVLTAQPADSSGVSVQVNLFGFDSWNGYVRLAVFDSIEFWPEDKDNAVLALTAPINGDTVVMDISALEPGAYAIAAFHDEDGDAVFDRGLFGVPTEDYGFSNNARSSTGPPDYQDALFIITGNTLVLNINLK